MLSAVMNADLSKTVRRGIEIDGSGILLKTGTVIGAKYAFYLAHKNGLEKEFYSDSASMHFDVLPQPGYYTATFFYKSATWKTSFKLVFLIDENIQVTIIDKIEIVITQQFKIDYYNRNSDITFIVFNGAGSTLASVPFGLKFLISQGYNVIACLHDNDQYQGLSFGEFKRNIESLVKGKTVFLYGSSLGAYSALYYAGAVNGNVIAAAPRNSAHPSVIERHGALSKYRVEDFRHKNYFENKLTSGSVDILVDPHDEQDMDFLNKFVLNVYPKTRLLLFGHAGHQVLFHVNRTGQLKRIINDIVTCKKDIYIDSEIDSEFSDLGRAKHYFRMEDFHRSAFYANRALTKGFSLKTMENQVQKLLIDAKVMINAQVKGRVPVYLK